MIDSRDIAHVFNIKIRIVIWDAFLTLKNSVHCSGVPAVETITHFFHLIFVMQIK